MDSLIINGSSHEMALMDRALEAIACVSTIGEAKQIADKAAAVRLYAAKNSWSRKAKGEIAEIEVRAFRRMGELLREMPKRTTSDSKGGGSKGSSREPLLDAPPTLSDIGVSKKQSHIAQRIASMPVEDMESYISQNKSADRISVRGLFGLAKKQDVKSSTESESPTGTASQLSELIERGEKFGTIYLDPPWQYGNQGTRASTDNHYGTMGQDDLRSLPVGELAAEKSHLHLWTTNGFLRDALDLIDEWGFEFKSTFVWVKPQIGIGNYWRCSHEIMLLGVRGGLTFPSSNVKSWIESPRGRHSAKPDAVRKLIEQMSPAPRIELFSRNISDGWISWGNQVPCESLLDGSVVR